MFASTVLPETRAHTSDDSEAGLYDFDLTPFFTRTGIHPRVKPEDRLRSNTLTWTGPCVERRSVLSMVVLRQKIGNNKPWKHYRRSPVAEADHEQRRIAAP
jgi:hypothetical protein